VELGIAISHRALADVAAHARNAEPAECCGLLVGTGTSVAEVVPARNLANLPTRFLIDPQDHIHAIRDARARGLEVLGFYHSHPHSAPVPSETDRAEVSYPDHLYLIVSLVRDPPEIRLFRFIAGNFREIPFVTKR
jgi:proteasome lid subunit RPN8/RPN11